MGIFNIIELNFIALCFAVMAYVYSVILTQPGHILNSLYNYLEENLNPFLFKPIIGCPLCVSGQMSLWVYPFITIYGPFDIEYNLFLHIYTICLTISL